MDMESNLNFRGARVVKAVAYAAISRSEPGSPVQLNFRSLYRNNMLHVTMTKTEARELAAQLALMGREDI